MPFRLPRRSRPSRARLASRAGPGGTGLEEPPVGYSNLPSSVGSTSPSRDHDDIAGVVHITSPNPLPERGDDGDTSEGQSTGRGRRPRHDPSSILAGLVMRTDPALALTGRRCVPRRLLEAGFEFRHTTFESAIHELISAGPP